jgi:alkylation response protein AidB-like acyl-CoA dehydrogenase
VDFTEVDEHRDLRAAARRPCAELWPALGAAVDAAIQTHGGNGLATEYGLVPYWGLARLLRIAPVNREMILNYVAQHSLGLPRSY